MDYPDITYVKTGEKMTKNLLAKYRKEDPGGLMMMHHMRMSDVNAAMQHEGVIIGSDGFSSSCPHGRNTPWMTYPQRLHLLGNRVVSASMPTEGNL